MSDKQPYAQAVDLSGEVGWWREWWPFTVHVLKTEQPYFFAVRSGAKPFEVRRNDRDFQPHDLLFLAEWTGDHHTGEWEAREVTYVLRDGEKFGVMSDFVVLGLGHPDLIRTTRHQKAESREKGSSDA